MDKKEQALAVCQMVTVHCILHGGGMDLDTAIRQLGLDNKECLKLAEEENLDWIADNIRKMI